MCVVGPKRKMYLYEDKQTEPEVSSDFILLGQMYSAHVIRRLNFGGNV